MPDEPLTLHLPPHLGDRFDLARLLAETGRWTGAEAFALLERFAVSGPERALVKAVLARRTNLWLFRCNQRRSCGDFVVVDMSAPDPDARAAWAIEVKAGAPLALGGARLQLANVGDAIAELVRDGVLGAAAPVELVYGDAAVVLAHLGVIAP